MGVGADAAFGAGVEKANAAGAQDGPDFGRQGLQGGGQFEVCRNSPGKDDEQLPEPLVDTDFAFEPFRVVSRICHH